MKIAYICTEKLPSPAVKGGAIQLMIDGVAPFLSQNHELTIFSITDPSLHEKERMNNIEYIRFPKETYEQNVAEELKKHAFDVIHVFNRPANVLLYKKASPTSAFVLSLHNDMFSPLKIKKDLAEQVLNETPIIATVSEYIKQTIMERYPIEAEKIKVVYSGVNIENYVPPWTAEGKKIREAIRAQFSVTNQKVILFIGRLSKTKGPHLLIECMKDVLAVHPDAVLVIVGGKWFSENGWSDYIETLHRLAEPYKNQIIFTNYIPSENIPHVFLMGDVFVCSSQWHEPLARVHYEAMAAGIPIITTNRGGNAEVIHHLKNGIVIHDYHSPAAFAETINDLLSNKEKALNLASNGRQFVEEHFQFSNTAQRLEACYMEAFTKHTHPLSR
jgi:glycosyltransferase involved in cell wall biosynthesis